MIKKIIACGDFHIRNIRRMEEYKEQFEKFFGKCKEIVNEEPETIIVITGDVFHNKLDISSEGYIFAHWVIEEFNKIAPTYIIAGNHDLNLKNLQRVSPIDTLFSIGKLDNVHFLDKELGYKSGCLRVDNVVLCLYSTYDNFARPKFEEYITKEDLHFVGLIHADIQGSKTDTTYSGDNGLATSYFAGLNVCLCGHIHRRQTLTYDETDIIYTGSLIQQDHGENRTGHGFIVWNIEDEECEEYDVENKDYGYYTFQINSENDIIENKEEVLNL